MNWSASSRFNRVDTLRLDSVSLSVVGALSIKPTHPTGNHDRDSLWAKIWFTSSLQAALSIAKADQKLYTYHGTKIPCFYAAGPEQASLFVPPVEPSPSGEE
jgi:hypothetical protein